MTDQPTGTRRPATRLAAEFMVIVVGVLVALAVDAAWEARSERDLEAVYLEQLQAELTEARQHLQSVMLREDGTAKASSEFFAAFQAGQLPPDSVLAALFGRAVVLASFEPPVGTVESLIATGDLRLIRDPEVRRLIPIYQASAVQARTLLSNVDQAALRTMERIGQRASLPSLMGLSTRHGSGWQAAASDPAFESDVLWLFMASESRRELLASLERSLDELESHLSN